MTARHASAEYLRSAVRWSRRALEVLRFAVLLISSTRVLVEGDSMLPALADGDRLLVSRLAFRLDSPRRGDIALLHDPSRPGYECIKRIVALPGEHVRTEGLAVVVDAAPAEPKDDGGRRLGACQYFVMGDNIARSADSRTYGPVTVRALLGRAWYRYASRSGAKGPL